jgi:hypothetical protein
VLAPVLALSACGGSQTESTAPHGAAASTTSAPSTTSTTAAAPKLPYSFDDNAPPPPLLNTGTNYVEIAKSLLDYSNWLLSHRPDSTLIERVAPRGSEAYGSLAHDLPILRLTSRRLYEVASAPRHIDVVSMRPGAVSLRDRQYLQRQVVVDSNGHLVDQRTRATVPTTYEVLLVRFGQRWYLASVTEKKT